MEWAGVLTSQDQNGLVTRKTYDDVGRLKTVTDAMNPPKGFITTYFYDLNGNLQSIQDANQHTTQFQYDTMNRRVHGNVRFLTNTAGTTTDTYQYDAFGMPIASTGTKANNYLYSGEQFDSSVGLYQLRDA
jgi:YD repeat-containing protein